VNELLTNKGVRYLGWPEWLKIDATEKRLGEAQSRERVKLVERQDFLDAAFQNNS
jgi:ferredoxin--NADP+ reductase